MLGFRHVIMIAVAAAVAVAWFVVAGRHAPPDDPDLARAKVTENGSYRVSIEPEAGQVTQGVLHSWIAAVETADGSPVVDAAIMIDGGMPDHGHGLPTAPQASHVGDGHYRIEGVRFNMAGWWELHLTISGPAGEDEVTFNIML